MFTTLYQYTNIYLFESTVNDKSVYISLFEISSMEIIKNKFLDNKNVVLGISCKNGDLHEIIYKNEKEVYSVIKKAFSEKEK